MIWTDELGTRACSWVDLNYYTFGPLVSIRNGHFLWYADSITNLEPRLSHFIRCCWTIVAILAREFLVTGARALAAAEGTVIAASAWGKTKTTIQMIYIYTFLFFAIVGEILDGVAPRYLDAYLAVLRPSSLFAIIVVAAFTVYSGIEFARANWRALNLGNVT